MGMGPHILLGSSQCRFATLIHSRVFILSFQSFIFKSNLRSVTLYLNCAKLASLFLPLNSKLHDMTIVIKYGWAEHRTSHHFFASSFQFLVPEVGFSIHQNLRK